MAGIKYTYFDAYEMRILCQSFNYCDQMNRHDLEIMYQFKMVKKIFSSLEFCIYVLW